MQEPSKDNSGDKIYRNTIDEDGNNVPLLDSHGHLILTMVYRTVYTSTITAMTTWWIPDALPGTGGNRK